MKSVGRRRGREYLRYNYWIDQDDLNETQCQRLETDGIGCYPTTWEKRMDGYKLKGYPSLLR